MPREAQGLYAFYKAESWLSCRRARGAPGGPRDVGCRSAGAGIHYTRTAGLPSASKWASLGLKAPASDRFAGTHLRAAYTEDNSCGAATAECSCALCVVQALLQAALQARLAPAPAPALPHAQRSEIASRPVARNGGSALEGGGSAAGEPAMGATGVITSGTRATPGRSGNFDGREHASALGTGGCAAPAACAALASAPRALPQTPSGPGRSRVGVDRGAAHPLLERVPHAGAFPTAPPIPRAAQASPGGMTCRALHGGLHDREPGDWRAAEGAARDARPAWDDTVALHAECRQRTPSPDPGLAPPHGPQAILSEALRRREALQRRMLATPQGLAQRGHPGSPRVAWQQARGAEAAAQQRCWGEHLGHAGASSEDRAGVRWRSPVRRRQGAIPEPSLGAVLHQLDALETRMAGLVGRAGAQLGGLDCNSHHRGPPESASPPRPASPAPVAAAAQAAACRKEGTQAEAAALPPCSADRGVPEAGAVDPGACATATAAGSHAGVLQTGRAGQPFGSGDRGVCSAAGVEQARVSGAGASDCAAELQAESPKRFPEQEGCAHAGEARSM